AYSVHGVAALAWLLLLFTAKEDSSVDLAGNHSRAEPTTPENLQRFYRIVLPAAPWVFGMAATGFAIVPALSNGAGESSLFYTTLAVALTMGMGTLIQPFVKRFNDLGKIQLLMAGLATSLAGLLLMIVVSLSGSEFLGTIAFVIAGAANGILLVAGLSQVLDLAGSA